jgi:hypothetical protein
MVLLLLLSVAHCQIAQTIFNNQPCRYLPTTYCWAENFNTIQGSLDSTVYDQPGKSDWVGRVSVTDVTRVC